MGEKGGGISKKEGSQGAATSSHLTHLPGLATLAARVPSHRGNSDITAGTGGSHTSRTPSSPV